MIKKQNVNITKNNVPVTIPISIDLKNDFIIFLFIIQNHPSAFIEVLDS